MWITVDIVPPGSPSLLLEALLQRAEPLRFLLRIRSGCGPDGLNNQALPAGLPSLNNAREHSTSERHAHEALGGGRRAKKKGGDNKALSASQACYQVGSEPSAHTLSKLGAEILAHCVASRASDIFPGYAKVAVRVACIIWTERWVTEK